MNGPPTRDFHPIYNAPMLGAHHKNDGTANTPPVNSTFCKNEMNYASRDDRRHYQRDWRKAWGLIIKNHNLSGKVGNDSLISIIRADPMLIRATLCLL